MWEGKIHNHIKICGEKFSHKIKENVVDVVKEIGKVRNWEKFKVRNEWTETSLKTEVGKILEGSEKLILKDHDT